MINKEWKKKNVCSKKFLWIVVSKKEEEEKKTYEINYEMKFSSNAIIYVILSSVCDSQSAMRVYGFGWSNADAFWRKSFYFIIFFKCIFRELLFFLNKFVFHIIMAETFKVKWTEMTEMKSQELFTSSKFSHIEMNTSAGPKWKYVNYPISSESSCCIHKIYNIFLY